MTVSEEHARVHITRAFPEFAVETVSFLGEGVDSAAYLVNEAWVFRFPKREVVSQALAREIALLPKLADQLPVAVPRFEYIGEQFETGLSFVGYRLIPGEPLTRELFESLSHDAQERVLETLSEFLEAVHSYSLEDAVEMGVPILNTRKLVEPVWKAARQRVLKQLSWRDGRLLESLIDRFLADVRNFTTIPCLLYADFAPEHILYDRTADRITGIIDWGDIAVGDPDFDATYLYQDYGAEFVRRLLLHSPHPDPARLFKKLRVFCAHDYLLDFVAISASDQAGERAAELAEAIEGLRRLAREA